MWSRVNKVKKNPIVFVISAPSGAGKTTLWGRLVREFSDIRRSVSCTTRKPRRDETNGINYHFVSDNEFNVMIKKGLFLEWAEVHGAKYGTMKSSLKQAKEGGYDLILEVDVKGAAIVRKKIKRCVLIYILPPDRDELKRRLENRNDLSKEDIEVRLKNAEKELIMLKKYDYAIINDSLEDAYIKLRSIVIAERCKVSNIRNIGRRVLEL